MIIMCKLGFEFIEDRTGVLTERVEIAGRSFSGEITNNQFNGDQLDSGAKAMTIVRLSIGGIFSFFI